MNRLLAEIALAMALLLHQWHLRYHFAQARFGKGDWKDGQFGALARTTIIS